MERSSLFDSLLMVKTFKIAYFLIEKKEQVYFTVLKTLKTGTDLFSGQDVFGKSSSPAKYPLTGRAPPS